MLSSSNVRVNRFVLSLTKRFAQYTKALITIDCVKRVAHGEAQLTTCCTTSGAATAGSRRTLLNR